MKMTLTTSDIARALVNDTDGGWSYNGAYVMAEYLEDLEDGTGEEMKLDVVAIRCDYSEHASLQEWAEGYFGGSEKWLDPVGIECDEDGEVTMSDSECDDAIREYIQDNGTLIEFDGGIIVSSF